MLSAVGHCHALTRHRILRAAYCSCRGERLDTTHEELTVHGRVLEERLAKLAGAVIVLLQAIEEGTGNEAAGAIRVLLESDYDADE
jgi:hypothetical protein